MSETCGISTSGYGLRKTMRAAYAQAAPVTRTGGGLETTKRVSDGGSPVSSNVPERLELDAEHDVADRDREVLVALGGARRRRAASARRR